MVLKILLATKKRLSRLTCFRVVCDGGSGSSLQEVKAIGKSYIMNAFLVVAKNDLKTIARYSERK